MPADHLLTTVLRAYQDPPNAAETDKIFGTTAHLLTQLNNPLNLSLLTSHFLTARAIWQAPDGLRTCMRIISVYNTAAIRVWQNERDSAELLRGSEPIGSGIRSEAWARAVSKGADERSSRWQHLLVLAGILMGMESEERFALSSSLRSTLEQAVVTAANLALQEPARNGPLGNGAIVLALAYALPLLSEPHKHLLDCSALMPAIMEAMIGHEGFQHGDFIQTITNEVIPEQNVWWYVNSPSAVRLEQLVGRPLVQNMGPVSRLAAFAVQCAADSGAVLRTQDDLVRFTSNLVDRWSACPLSKIDDLSGSFAAEVLQGPWTTLWQLFKKIMYTVVAILQPIVGRSLLDLHLSNHGVAPALASKSLHILRSLSFVSSRQGASAFQVYTFTYLTSLDVLARYPDACAAFLQETQPPSPQTTIVPSTLNQALTLFYLNVAEHLPLSLPTPACESLVVTHGTAHLAPTSWLTSPANISRPSSLTLEIFESSHSAVLAALSCPQHSALTVSIIPFYIDTLLSSFPARISPRQFRLAFKTVMQIASPPFPIASSHPELSETLLEMLRSRASPAEGGASVTMLPQDPAAALAAATAESQQRQIQSGQDAPPPPPMLSEQSTLVLALIDSLPFLPLFLVEDWLSRAADAMNEVADPALRDVCRRRYWDVLVSGEMDVERAAIGVAWWGTRGGREMVLLGRPSSSTSSSAPSGSGDEFMMSGALGLSPSEEGNGSKRGDSRL